MHNIGVCHRDIKIENILYTKVNEEYVFKLCDFGSATRDHSVNYQKASKKEISDFVEQIES